MSYNPLLLLVTSDFPPGCTGGIQRYYHDLCNHAGGRIHVLAPDCTDRQFDRSQPFYIKRARVPLSSNRAMRFIQAVQLALAALLLSSRKRYEVLLLGHWYLCVIGAPLFVLLKHRYAVVLHGGEVAPYEHLSLFKTIFQWSIGRADSIIANSEYTKRQYVDFGLPESKIFVLTPGVDPSRFEPSESSPALVWLRPRMSSPDPFVLLTIATLVERKGHDVVIRALHYLRDRAPNIHYIVVGKGPNEHTLSELAQSLQLADRVHFVGRLPDSDLGNIYRTCDVFVMPSRCVKRSSAGVEGFGMVYLEANVCGKPVIAGRGSGAEEAVAEGVSGLLVDPSSVQEVAQAILSLRDEPMRCKELGATGRHRAETTFSWPEKSNRLCAILLRRTSSTNN